MRSNKELTIKNEKKYRTNRYVAKKQHYIQTECETSQNFDVRVNRHYWNITVFTPRFQYYILNINESSIHNRIWERRNLLSIIKHDKKWDKIGKCG